MEFKEENVGTFIKFFESIQPTICSFEGCVSVDLYQEAHATSTYFTVSRWKDEEALNNYRSSAFFGKTWKKTKAMFSGKPVAYSLIS